MIFAKLKMFVRFLKSRRLHCTFCFPEAKLSDLSAQRCTLKLLVIVILTLCNWHSNTSVVKNRHLALMTLHNHASTSHLTEHIHCLRCVSVCVSLCVCVCTDKDRDTEMKMERKRYDPSISSFVSASFMLVPISCSLH